jgi:hypothetical protein
MDRVLVGAVVAAHFGFIGYVALGGLLAWRWPRTVAVHVVAVAWGFSTLAFGLACPLTEVENAVRARAGLPLLGPEGFAGHYLAYESHRNVVRAVFATLVLCSWLVLAQAWLRRQHAAAARTAVARPPAAVTSSTTRSAASASAV